MSGRIDPVRLQGNPSGVTLRWVPRRHPRPANDDWNPEDWHILIVSARDPGLFPHPIRVAIVRDCRRGLARLQGRGQPVLHVLARFRVPEEKAARDMVAKFRRGLGREESLGDDWFAMSRTYAVEHMGSLLIDVVRDRLRGFSEPDRQIMLDYCGLNEASRFLEAEEVVRKSKQRTKRSRRRPSSPTPASAAGPERARR